MLRNPGPSLVKHLNDVCGARDSEFQVETLQRSRQIVENSLGTELRTGAKGEAAPTLTDRLSFNWKLMRQADVAVWKLKKSDVPDKTNLETARRVFAALLAEGVQKPLVEALVDLLRLDSDSRFLRHYWLFRRSKVLRPESLAPPLSNAIHSEERTDLRRVIWWCLRARREEYVEIRPQEPVRVEFSFLVEQILDDLQNLFGSQLPGDAASDIETELNAWLTYSGLQEPTDGAVSSGEEFSIDPKIARAYVKFNDLKTKLHISRSAGAARPSKREALLEAQLREYVEENRTLEEKLRTMGERPQPTEGGGGPDSEALLRLGEVLRTIDTKYALDTLNDVQRGSETHLTLRSFVAHLFYSLRKQGLAEYPTTQEFDLTYEDAGLYDCDGFEVQPGTGVHVRVVRPGWALQSRGRSVPIRRARVAKVASVED